ncbi:MAG TPA: hypothetical protein VFA52_04560 [Candidatus Paceibacterota bacterium]|jgi:hypothetical protein|nr:hypothetical protein [Candidatus Paceibacterota bacterium]
MSDFAYVDAKIIPGKIAVPIEDLTNEQRQQLATEEFERLLRRYADSQTTRNVGLGLGENL